MTEQAAVAPEVEPPLSRDELLASIEALKTQHPELAEVPEDEAGAQPTDTEETAEVPEDEQDPAEVQGDDQDHGAQEAALGRMSAKDFARETGITLEELYRDVILSRDGEEVSISQLVDESKAHKTAIEALERERADLRQKAEQAPHGASMPQVSPNAQALLVKAQLYQEALDKNDWSGMDAGQEAKAKVDAERAIRMLVQQAQEEQQKHLVAVQEHVGKAREQFDTQMRTLVPEWNDARVKAAQQQQIRDIAKSYGFQPQEIEAVMDPRAMRVWLDLLKAKQLETRVESGAKKLKKLSRKTLGGGARQTDKPKASVEDTRARLRDPKLSRGEAQKLRLTMPLGE